MNNSFMMGQNTKCFLLKDEFNFNRSERIYSALEDRLNLTENPDEAGCFIAVGGDGSLLKAVLHPQRGSKPIIGLNSGTVGKNLIDVKGGNLDLFIDKFLAGECLLIKFPMIEVVATSIDGRTRTFHAFNDAWVDRQYARSVRYHLGIRSAEFTSAEDDTISLCDSFISGDGVLVCTPVGSTGYARMLGEMVLPLHTNTVLVNPMASMVDKRKVHSFALDYNQTLHVQFDDLDFRPNRLAVDGVYVDFEESGNHFCVREITVRMENPDIKSVTLVCSDMNIFMKKQIDFIAR